MLFEADEIRRIEDVHLVLLGIQPSELSAMDRQLRYDVLELHAVREELKWQRK